MSPIGNSSLLYELSKTTLITSLDHSCAFALHTTNYRNLQSCIKRIITHNSPLITSSLRDITKSLTSPQTALLYHYSLPPSLHPSLARALGYSSESRVGMPKRESHVKKQPHRKTPTFNHLQKLWVAPVGKMRPTYCL